MIRTISNLLYLFSFKIISIFAMFICNNTLAQSPYKIDTFTIQYDTLTDYNSIALENLNNGKYWAVFDREMELGFEFPFFNTNIEKVDVESDAVFSFDDTRGWFNLYALDNNWHTCSEPESFQYAKNDYRYKTEKVNGIDVFKIEWHEIAICETTWENATKPFNFQVWLWGNGNMDFITGSLNKTDTTIYKEGLGFIYEEGGNPGSIGIVNPENDYALFYSGLYDNPIILEGIPDSILYFERGTIKSLPHEGFVIRFKKQTSSTTDAKPSIPYPNVVVDILTIPTDFPFSEYRILDMSGREIKKGIDREIDLSFLQNGYYVIKLKDGAGIYSYKFVKL